MCYIMGRLSHDLLCFVYFLLFGWQCVRLRLAEQRLQPASQQSNKNDISIYNQISCTISIMRGGCKWVCSKWVDHAYLLYVQRAQKLQCSRVAFYFQTPHSKCLTIVYLGKTGNIFIFRKCMQHSWDDLIFSAQVGGENAP